MKIHGNGVNICVFFVHFTDHQSVIYVPCPRAGHPNLTRDGQLNAPIYNLMAEKGHFLTNKMPIKIMIAKMIIFIFTIPSYEIFRF